MEPIALATRAPSELAPTHRPPREIRAALRDSAAVGLGLVPLGLAFGVVIVHAGLPWWSATLFTSTIYAGSFEFLLVPLAVALAPLATIALTAFLVNVRHVFYALSFPLQSVEGRLAKTYSTFALTDEAYALTATDRARTWSGRRIVCLQALLHVYWVTGATAGALLGVLIPDSITGMDFSMTALFTVLALDALRDRRADKQTSPAAARRAAHEPPMGDVSTPALALFSALIARWVFPSQMLLAAFALFTVGLLIRRAATSERAVDA